MRAKLGKALRAQAEVEDTIAQVTSELRQSKESYEEQIVALNGDLARANQVNNELKVGIL